MDVDGERGDEQPPRRAIDRVPGVRWPPYHRPAWVWVVLVVGFVAAVVLALLLR